MVKFKKINVLIFIMSFIIGCSIDGTDKNDSIDNEIRLKIKVQTDKLVEAIIKSDSTKLYDLLSDALKKKVDGSLGSYIEECHQHIQHKSYSILDEFYSKSFGNNKSEQPIIVYSDNKVYSIKFEALNKETYVSLLLLNEKNNQMLLTCIYGKYGDIWKLNVLQIGQYSVFGKSAIDFFELAKQDYAKNNLINTIIDIDLINQTVKPANQYFTYQEDSVMQAFSKKIFIEANLKYPLPITLNEIPTTPQIINVSPQIIDEGIFPIVKYKTKLNIKDTGALRKENNDIQKIIANIFPKINNNKKYIFFQAYNEIPNGNKKIDSYGFVMKFN